ncbi:hypothetical protein DY000_02003176 [Brassica cretica]|uniref:Endonuclease/exonuclease/phosphatase domain-containing protein n=1 Tax=Brassica cretica TaxID=69181 RepID=A0ABQ7C811_BRACR|nr:hypothetical protein DY000_02003176 [Brassica cretica]
MKVCIISQSSQAITFTLLTEPGCNSLDNWWDCLHQIEVYDLQYYGPHLTWTNKQSDSQVAKKLDHQLINSHITSAFPHTTTFLPPLFSDHCPCLVDLDFQLPKVGTYPFRFLNYLTKHPNFTEAVADAWFQAGNLATTLTDLCWNALRAL